MAGFSLNPAALQMLKSDSILHAYKGSSKQSVPAMALVNLYQSGNHFFIEDFGGCKVLRRGFGGRGEGKQILTGQEKTRSQIIVASGMLIRFAEVKRWRLPPETKIYFATCHL